MIRRFILCICVLCVILLGACSRQEKPKLTPLMKAAYGGNSLRVEKLLSQGANVLEVYPQTQKTILMMAVQHPDIVEKILQIDSSNINAQTTEGWSALMFVTPLVPTPEKSIELLIKYGADTELKDKNGRTAISWAAGYGNIKALQALIAAQADINTLDNDHQTPLMWAATMGKNQAFELLLQAGADINIVDKNGSSVFMRVNKINLSLPKDIALNTQLISYGMSPLDWAAIYNNISLIRALIKNGMSPNTTNQNRTTPLMRAAGLGNNQAIKILLEKGADIQAKDKNGNTALTWAVLEHDFPKTIKLLLQHGAKVDEKNHDGITPLMWAAALGLKKSVKLLLEQKADPNLLDNKGRSAFAWAVRNGHTDIAYLLLDSGNKGRRKHVTYIPEMLYFNLPEKFEYHGKKLELEKAINYMGDTPLLLAITTDNLPLVKEIIRAGANVNTADPDGVTPLMWASIYQSLEITKLLLQAGADVNLQSPRGNSALMLAASFNNKEIVEELLKHKADVNLKNKFGETALFRASTLKFQLDFAQDQAEEGTNPDPLPQNAAQKHAEIAKLLIQHGANVNETNNENKTPLLWAVSLPGHAPIVKVLLDAGADVHHKNNKGLDALARAKKTNDPEILQLLQKNYLRNKQ